MTVLLEFIVMTALLEYLELFQYLSTVDPCLSVLSFIRN